MTSEEYCLTVGTIDHEGKAMEERLHMHIEAPNEEAAIAVVLHQCIANNVSVRECVVVVTRVVAIPAETVDYMEKARLLNHGHDAPLQPGAIKNMH